MSYNVHITMKSRNAKTGPIPVSTTTFDTCPDACPLRANGCYAEHGPLGMHWRKVTEGKTGQSWESFCDVVASMPADTLWRHNQSGDLPGNRIAIDSEALASLVKANAGKRGFTYTHYNMAIAGNLEAVKHANKHGFTINLSANSLRHADALASYGLPVVTVLPSTVDGATTPSVTTPQGNKVVVCPATYRDGISCATCKLCAVRDRKVIIGFPAHGVTKKRADSVTLAA